MPAHVHLIENKKRRVWKDQPNATRRPSFSHTVPLGFPHPFHACNVCTFFDNSVEKCHSLKKQLGLTHHCYSHHQTRSCTKQQKEVWQTWIVLLSDSASPRAARQIFVTLQNKCIGTAKRDGFMTLSSRSRKGNFPKLKGYKNWKVIDGVNFIKKNKVDGML